MLTTGEEKGTNDYTLETGDWRPEIRGGGIKPGYFSTDICPIITTDSSGFQLLFSAPAPWIYTHIYVYIYDCV